MKHADGRSPEDVVLGMLSVGPTQGYDLCARLARRVGLTHGAAYGELYTLEARGFVDSRSEVGSDGVERRWYSLTGAGERRAAAREVKEAVPGAAAAAGAIA